MIKKFLTTKNTESDNDVLTFIASTSNPDRYGDIIAQDGWELDAYRRNPVVLLNHRADTLPVGKGDVRMDGENLLIDIEFDTDEESQKVAGKAKRGFLHAVSVGFNPSKSIKRSDLSPDHKYYATKGMFFQNAELLEVSIVTIPANSHATAAKGLTSDLEQLRSLSDRLAFEALKSFQNELKKRHIIQVEEDEDKFIIHYAKITDLPFEEEEEQAEEEEEQVLIEEEESKKDEEEEYKNLLFKALIGDCND
jgi:HK97 family phage prohead protease